MQSVRFTAETSSNGVIERDFTVGDIPGVLWSPARTSPADGSPNAPLVLMGHGGGQHKKIRPLKARALDAVSSWGFTVAAIDAPGHGNRPRTATDDQARADIRQAYADNAPDRVRSVSVSYTATFAERAVEEWQVTLDALQALPEIGREAPVGYGGGISTGTAIGVPLTAVEPRISAAIFGGGFFVYEDLLEAAGRVTVPVLFLLPWDDELVTREESLGLFDAFASKEKTLHANPGDHRTIRWTGIDKEFLPRHLGRIPGADSASRLRRGVVLRSDAEDSCEVLTGGETVTARYAPQFPSPRRERVRPGHLVAIAGTGESASVVWRWYDAIVLGSDTESVRLWEPSHGEVTARRRRPWQHYAPGSRAYLSAGLPGADWWVAGSVVPQVGNADVELDEVERLYAPDSAGDSVVG